MSELSEPRIEISVDYWLSLSVRGIHEFATVTKEFGDYLQGKDPTEAHYHVEYMPNNLVKVYPIRAWRESVERIEKQKKQSELERQERYKREEEERLAREELERKQQEREKHKWALLSDIKAKFPNAYAKHGADLIWTMVQAAANGENEPFKQTLAKKGITLDNL